MEDTAIASPPPKPKTNIDEDWIENIFARQEKIYEFEDNTQKTLAKI